MNTLPRLPSFLSTILRFPWLVFGLVSLCYLGLATWFNYYMNIASLDTWCYMAPACFAEWPLDLSRPLLGEFLQADRVWGLHWPGAIWLSSAVLCFLPNEPLMPILLMNIYMVALGWVLAVLVAKVTRLPWVGVVAGTFVFLDRAVSWATAEQRQEVLAGVFLLLLVYEITKERSKWTLALIGLWSMCAVISHPMAFLAVPGLPVLMWICRRGPEIPRALALWAGCAAGVAVLMLYLFAGGAWPVFREHSAMAAGMLDDEVIVFRAFRQLSPNYVGHIMYGLSLLVTPWVLWKLRAQKGTLPAVIAASFCFLIMLFSVFAKGHNPYYLAISVPFCIVLIAVFWAMAWQRFEGRLPRAILVLAATGLLILQCDYWAFRAIYFRAHGAPNSRAALYEIWKDIPPGRNVFIPQVLWEVEWAMPRGAMMNSLPHAATDERQAQYGETLAQKLKPGDILIRNPYYPWPEPIYTDRESDWRLVKEIDKDFKMQVNVRGWNLKIFEYAPQTPQGE